jgi:hypothetical protein
VFGRVKKKDETVVQTTEFILMLDNLAREFVGGIVVYV